MLSILKVYNIQQKNHKTVTINMDISKSKKTQS